MTDHAKLAPSSAARRILCPGSRALEAMFPDAGNEASREGNKAHEVLERFLTHAFTPYFHFSDTSNGGQMIPNEMIEGAEIFFAHVRAETEGFTRMQFGIEDKLTMETIHPEAWGTADYWQYSISNQYNIPRIDVWDYKYGYKAVEVLENWQLIAYAAGVLERLTAMTLPDHSDTTIAMHIVQPRAYHKNGVCRTWKTTLKNLQFYFNQLRNAEHASMQPDAPRTPSPEACKYCKGRHTCDALKKETDEAVVLAAKSNELSPPPDFIGREITSLRRGASMIEARLTGLEEQALATLRKGQRIPGFKIGYTKPYDKWTCSAQEIKLLGDLYGKDLTKPLEVITPKQAIDKGIPAEDIAPYYIQPAGTAKLEVDDINKVAKMFGATK
jgi:hypothetical protein